MASVLSIEASHYKKAEMVSCLRYYPYRLCQSSILAHRLVHIRLANVDREFESTLYKDADLLFEKEDCHETIIQQAEKLQSSPLNLLEIFFELDKQSLEQNIWKIGDRCNKLRLVSFVPKIWERIQCFDT